MSAADLMVQKFEISKATAEAILNEGRSEAEDVGQETGFEEGITVQVKDCWACYFFRIDSQGFIRIDFIEVYKVKPDFIGEDETIPVVM